ncbi:MAG: Asp-tRNA(Asn)/Glu-tRNA(Gln) amidotransferase subunit GatC [Planctomycetota bacterium]
MPIGRAAVEKVFHLARITPRPGEIDKFALQLDAVLNYMDTLNKLDTAAVALVGNIAGLADVFRDDSPGVSLGVADVLVNAPSADGVAFVVPKVI